MLIIANWKAYFSYAQAIEWMELYGKELHELMKRNNNNSLVLCPSFDALACIVAPSKHLLWGAQDCSPYEAGAYTGEVLAQSLAQIGCSYCLIGHTERRLLFHETTLAIILKLEQLITYNITPIICIGENEQEYQADNAQNIITAQLTPILEYAQKQEIPHLHIAYEPLWSIGTHEIPPKDHLDRMATHIQKLTNKHAIKSTLLYGGSINSSTIDPLYFEHFQGFLIGKASTDFQELKKIILSV